MKISDKTYKVLKYIAMYFMPALATLIITLGMIWQIPYTEPIAATITALDVFLSALLGLSSSKFFETHDIIDVSMPKNDTYCVENAALYVKNATDDIKDLESEKAPQNGKDDATGAC